jgi:hypothetical protein
MTTREVAAPGVAPSVAMALRLIEREHGPILGAPALWHLLGYKTADAFRKAVQRGTVPVPTFPIPDRRGRFAHTAAVVQWLESLARQPPAPGGREVTTEP